MLSGLRNKYLNILLPLGYIILLLLACAAACRARGIVWGQYNIGLVHWDAGWYRSIVDEGYVFHADRTNNTAFFPLFPYIWKWSGLGATGISIFNGLIFLTGCFALFSHFRSGWKVRVLYILFSLILFYILPYSESIFFLFATLLLIGLDKDKPALVLLGILGAGLARSVCTVFFPAFILIGLSNYLETKDTRRLSWCISYSLLCIAILLSVFAIHWYQTGVWMAFSKTQTFWNSGFRLPNSPFSSWDPPKNVHFDQYALFIAFLCFFCCAWSFIAVLLKRKGLVKGNAALFSFYYLGGVAMLMLFTRGGTFNSINRYVFATPFFYLFLREVANFRFSLKIIIGVLIAELVYLLVFWHMGTTLTRWFVLLLLLAGTVAFPYYMQQQRPMYLFIVIAIIGSLAVQAWLCLNFISNIWVG